jgi:hypothetical protein
MAGQDDFPFGHVNQWRMDPVLGFTFHACLSGEFCQSLECLEKLRPAIGIAGIVDGVYADEDVLGLE